MSGDHSINLPSDLYEQICMNLSTDDLARICYASRSFYMEASRVLYREVTVNDDQAMQFCSLITECPRLIPMVRILRIGFNANILNALNANVIMNAFQLLGNLHELELKSVEHQEIGVELLLRGCKSALRRFNISWDFGEGPGLIAFLAAQPGIVHLAISPPRRFKPSHNLVPVDVLPALSSIDTNETMLACFASQSLTHVRIQDSTLENLPALLRPFSLTLTSLDIQLDLYTLYITHAHHFYTNTSILPDLMGSLKELAPNLKFLGVSEPIHLSLVDVRLVVLAAARLNLQTLVVGDAHNESALSTEAVEEYTTLLRTIIASSSSLSTLIFRGVKSSHTFIRSASGTISEVNDEYDVSMWQHTRR